MTTLPAGSRVVLCDNNKDHDAHRFEKLSEFFRVLEKANTSGKGFKLAYVGDVDPSIFEDWAAGVWEILDGNKLTHIVAEEYAYACNGPGEIQKSKFPNHSRLWTQSRKYGGIIYATSQRPQLISKDAVDNAETVWASNMGFAARERIAKEIGVTKDDIANCRPGEFYHFERSQLRSDKEQVFIPLNN